MGSNSISNFHHHSINEGAVYRTWEHRLVRKFYPMRFLWYTVNPWTPVSAICLREHWVCQISMMLFHSGIFWSKYGTRSSIWGISLGPGLVCLIWNTVCLLRIRGFTVYEGSDTRCLALGIISSKKLLAKTSRWCIVNSVKRYSPMVPTECCGKQSHITYRLCYCTNITTDMTQMWWIHTRSKSEHF
jgi:hypothetical protein